jgi:hypothetical protein
MKDLVILKTSYFVSLARKYTLKRAAGIEPALLAWKAKVLPLNYARIAIHNRKTQFSDRSS